MLSAFSFERVLTEFGDIVEMQGKYLAREINITEGKHKLLSARVDSFGMISSSDAALTPPPTAVRTEVGSRIARGMRNVAIDNNVMVGHIIKKPDPTYPPEAKKAHIQGKVVLVAVIGTDGKTHELRVVSAPSAWLADSSFRAVSQWEYKPYLLNGLPVAVDTTITVTFALGR